jgi:hypothetical protein
VPYLAQATVVHEPLEEASQDEQEKQVLGRLLLQKTYHDTKKPYVWEHFSRCKAKGPTEDIEAEVTGEDNLYLLVDPSFSKDFVRNVAAQPSKFQLLTSSQELLNISKDAVLFAHYQCKKDSADYHGFYRCHFEKF